MVDEEIRTHSAMLVGQPNKFLQVLLILVREFIPGTLDTVIQVHYGETVMASRGFSPSPSQLFGASSWAHSDPQQPDRCRLDERSLALQSVDEPWIIERRVAHNHEGLHSFSRR